MNFHRFVLFLIYPWCVWGLSKRYLIVPPTAPTRHQWIVGVGVPLGLEEVEVVSGYVFKAQYFLPTQASDWRPSYSWEGFEKRKRSIDSPEMKVDQLTGQKYESYDVEAVLVNEERINETVFENTNSIDDFWDVENETNQQKQEDAAAYAFWHPNSEEQISNSLAENSRWHAYNAVASIAKSHGIGEKSCVLRMICEGAETPISYKSGILGELLHIFLTPSTSKDKLSSDSDMDYHKAEELGKSGASCEEIYGDCKKSMLDVFTKLHNPFDAITNMLTNM